MQKRNDQLQSEKATMETSLIARVHDLENNRREIERQMSSIVLPTKTKERKRMVGR